MTTSKTEMALMGAGEKEKKKKKEAFDLINEN